MADTLQPMWAVSDVAAHIGVSPATVRAYLARGQMPAPDGRLGRAPWWKPATITEWHQGRPGPGRHGPRAHPAQDGCAGRG